MIVIRDAQEGDIDRIREIYLATYGQDYAYPEFYDAQCLRRMIYGEENLLLVAEQSDTQRILGTASVVMDVSAYADLVGEFGRLAVHPDARGQGVGKRLMQERLERVQNRLHLGLVDNRVTHPFSQRISERFGFRPMGCLPMKLLVGRREHIAVFGQYFGPALQLRRNNHRIIPEVHALAELALDSFELPSDCIVDDAVEPYPYDADFAEDELSSDGYASLLRIERGRVRNREVFGPLSLHYGLFKLKAHHCNYLLARRDGRVVGAIGFTIDDVERAVRIIELISTADEVIRFLFSKLLDRCRRKLHIEYLEIDVSANAPRLQRTLLELGFMPAAYVPAMVFQEVERIDAVKMVSLLVPFERGDPQVTDLARPFLDLILDEFQSRAVVPVMRESLADAPLLAGLTAEQIQRVGEACVLRSYQPGTTVYQAGEKNERFEVIVRGELELYMEDRKLATLGAGQCLGERLLLDLVGRVQHLHTVSAIDEVETLSFQRRELRRLLRRRPDIGVILFRNVAFDLAQKLANRF